MRSIPRVVRVRLQPAGRFPIGGPYNLPIEITASGIFEDYGTPRCRFRSVGGGPAGGVWLSEGGIVRNGSYFTCDKPRFPDSIRSATSGTLRYEVAVSANGQCFRPYIVSHAASQTLD